MPPNNKLGRIAGLLYLLIIVIGLIAQVFERNRLVHYDNETIKAKNLLSSNFLYRFCFLSELLMLVCDVGVTTILYILLKRTDSALSIASTFFRFCSIVILACTALTHYAALSFLKQSPFLSIFTTGQFEAFALLTIKTHGTGYNISLFFFGFHLALLGHLIFKSIVFPRFVGILLFIGGLCYVINSLTWFLFPGLTRIIYPAILIPCALGEWIFCFWLLIKGVKVSSQIVSVPLGSPARGPDK